VQRLGTESCGVVFKITPQGTETILHSFAGGADGYGPNGNLVRDSAGNLYGTTFAGGAASLGTVFKLTPDGTETVLHSFTGGSDGSTPYAGLVLGHDGNLYGTTYQGGAFGGGTVFKLTPDGSETVLHSFSLMSSDGHAPQVGLLQGNDGNFYGTTSVGGASGDGTAYKITPAGTETLVYSFTGKADGMNPNSALIEDAAGNLYGTADPWTAAEASMVYKLGADGTLSVLHTFAGGNDGSLPNQLMLARDGNLYGVTSYEGQYLGGTAFRIAPDGTETVLHAFGQTGDGSLPVGALVQDRLGRFYGVTLNGGGDQKGTVFRLTVPKS
jgi:uncharacterized repeat protein (TIGR03803 family)